MDVADLSIEVRAKDLTRVGLISMQDWANVLIVPRANNIGSWSIDLPDRVIDPNTGIESPHPMCAALRTPGYGVIVTGPNGVILSGPLTSATHNATTDDPGGTWTLVGVSDTAVLAYAECWPDPATADPNAATSANDVRTSNAENLIRAYVRVNIGDLALSFRKNAYLDMGPNGNRGPTLKKSPRYDNLLTLCQEIAVGTGLQFQVVQVGSRLQFQTWMQADRTLDVRLDIENDQLQSEAVSYQAPGVTTIIVMGQGQGTERKFITRTNSAATAAGADWGVRIEQVLDQRQTNDDDELAAAGDDVLAVSGKTITAIRVVPGEDLIQSFQVGDLITVVVGNQETVAQCTEQPIKVDKQGVYVTCTIGDPSGFDWESLIDRRQSTADQRISNLESNAEIPTDTGPLVAGNGYLGSLYFTATGAFTIASYPLAKAIRVRCVGGGGSGGGAPAVSSGNHADGGGGGGGGYAEAYLPVAGLAASIPVTVGAGGGNTTGTGLPGGTSSFGTQVVATGGVGGGAGQNNALAIGAQGGTGGIGTAGDLLIKGSEGGVSSGYATLPRSGQGGDSMMGGGAGGTYTGSSGGRQAGAAGGQYGGGGSGAANAQSATAGTNGGAGANGIVIVDLYG